MFKSIISSLLKTSGIDALVAVYALLGSNNGNN